MKLFSLVIGFTVASVSMLTWPALAADPPPPDACFNSHCDTALDISHADITAQLIGCNVKRSDGVLVNGKSEDGVLWELLGVSGPKEKPIDPRLGEPIVGLKRSVTYSEVRFRLRPGYYSALTVSVGDCNFGPFPLATTGASGDRHITLIRQPMPPVPPVEASSTGGVYGFAPIPGLQITLTGVVHQEMLVARNEMDLNPYYTPHGELYLYYFDAVPPGHYIMTVHGFGWAKTLSPVVVPKPGEIVFRNIRINELGLVDQ